MSHQSKDCENSKCAYLYPPFTRGDRPKETSPSAPALLTVRRAITLCSDFDYQHGDNTIARRYSRPQPKRGPQTRINDQIRSDRVRVVDPEGEHGIYDTSAALELAQRRGLDLVEVAPDADPPVAKIMDYGKYRYEQQKKEKEQRKKAHKVELKEIRFRPNTDDHDFNFKTKHAREFLEEGNQVKAWVQFRGRDIIYKERGADLLARFIETLSDISRVEQLPKMEGRRMTVMLTPDKSAKKN